MELNRIESGTGKSPVSHGRAAAAATADSGFEAVISDEGVEMSSVVRARGETSRTVLPAAGGTTGPPVDTSTRDLGVWAQSAVDRVASHSTSGELTDPQSRSVSPLPANWMYNERGRSPTAPVAVSPLGQQLDVTG